MTARDKKALVAVTGLAVLAGLVIAMTKRTSPARGPRVFRQDMTPEAASSALREESTTRVAAPGAPTSQVADPLDWSPNPIASYLK